MRWIKKWGYYSYSVLEMMLNIKNWPKIIPFFLQRSLKRRSLLKLRRPPVEILVRSAMDIWSVKETFFDQFYTRYGVPIQDGWTVMDIGAGIGDFCIYAAHGNPSTEVYAFEPFYDSFELLKENLALNGIQNVKVIQKAVWGEETELKLQLSNGEPLQISSHHQFSGEMTAENLTVDAISLESAMLFAQIQKVDLLKMDCEGAEYEILLNAAPEALSRVARIIMEYHDIDQVHTHPKIIAFLEDQGYKVTCYRNQVHDDIGYLFAGKT